MVNILHECANLVASIQGRVTAGEGVEGAGTDPPHAQLLVRVPGEPADVCACESRPHAKLQFAMLTPHMKQWHIMGSEVLTA